MTHLEGDRVSLLVLLDFTHRVSECVSLLQCWKHHFNPSIRQLQKWFCKLSFVRVPATSYLVPLFTLIYLVLLHLLLPSYLNVPCYLNNRQRYCPGIVQFGLKGIGLYSHVFT
jgi:hypothetical protein